MPLQVIARGSEPRSTGATHRRIDGQRWGGLAAVEAESAPSNPARRATPPEINPYDWSAAVKIRPSREQRGVVDDRVAVFGFVLAVEAPGDVVTGRTSSGRDSFRPMMNGWNGWNRISVKTSRVKHADAPRPVGG